MLAMMLAEGAAEGEHGGGLLDMAARLFNFAVLAGTLVYFLGRRLPGTSATAARRFAATS